MNAIDFGSPYVTVFYWYKPRLILSNVFPRLQSHGGLRLEIGEGGGHESARRAPKARVPLGGPGHTSLGNFEKLSLSNAISCVFEQVFMSLELLWIMSLISKAKLNTDTKIRKKKANPD